jgi:nitroimidazol reductase NimA-like FMN-containing flavoprotein (pyridoxamine 5'-phosphate oxidase superfamily)
VARYETEARNRVRQLAEKARYDHESVHGVLDAGLVCQVAFSQGDQPFIVPMIYGRRGQTLYLHGARKARVIRLLAANPKICVHVTLLDGIVLARSTFSSSMNYRSVSVFGSAELVDDPAEKEAALQVISEQVMPGRWAEVRPSTDREIAMTGVLRLPIESASAKISSGPPDDEEEDYAASVWAGVLPLVLQAGALQPDPVLDPNQLPSDIMLALEAKIY